MRGRKSRSPHNFSRETRKGLPLFGLRAADRGPQDSPTLSRQRERDCLRPLGKQTVSAILKTNQKICFAHYSAARHSERAPSALALVNRSAWNRLSFETNQIYRFFGYLIKTHNIPMICFAHYSAARHSEQAPSALALVNRSA